MIKLFFLLVTKPTAMIQNAEVVCILRNSARAGASGCPVSRDRIGPNTSSCEHSTQPCPKTNQQWHLDGNHIVRGRDGRRLLHGRRSAQSGSGAVFA